MKYVCVFYGGGMPDAPAAQDRLMKQWTSWYTKLGSAVADAGLPFSGAVNKIKAEGVSKGPIGQRATGYAILEAASLDKATKMAKGCPILKSGGSIAVYETASMM